MASQKRAFGDITNQSRDKPAQRGVYSAPFFKSEKTNALINYYKK